MEERGWIPGADHSSTPDLHQRTRVVRWIRTTSQHPSVTIEFDCDTDSVKLPPERRIPGHQEHRQHCDREKSSITSCDMTFLVAQHKPE